MLSMTKVKAMKYLKKEYNQLQNDESLGHLGFTVGIVNNDIFHWKFTLAGPSDTVYDGLFSLTIDFPENYPMKKPEVRFINKIYHLNVRPSDGHINIITLNNWKIGSKMIEVISDIYSLFYKQNPSCPYSLNMAFEYQNNRSEFDRKVKEWTKEYASFP